MEVFNGTGVGGKKVSGYLHFFKNTDTDTHETKKFTTYQEEIDRLKGAKEKAKKAVVSMHKRALEEIGANEAEIFEIHLMLLDDEDLNETIEYEISQKKCVESAIKLACAKYADMLRDLDDEYLAERARDIKDVENQLLKALKNDGMTEIIDTSPYILVADDLTPSQTVMLDKSKILGFITFSGSHSSHTAILARAMGIPAIVGVGRIDNGNNGKFALLDSQNGSVVINPTEKEAELFKEKERQESQIAREHEKYLRSLINKPAISKSGHRVLIYANIGSEKEVENAILNGAEGVGLFRSELHYLSLDRFPSEDELYRAYRDAAVKMGDRRVIIRTLDVGADKQLPYLNIPNEENPALGYRGVRVCLDREDIFKTQLRAILRASAHGRVAIMLPMIISESEIIRCKGLLEKCKNELFEENYAFDSTIEMGIMIETPASVIMCDTLARYVSFFSVGTNDLTQYTLAIDRQNPKVADLAEINKEPVLRLIRHASEQIHKNGGWIGVCGEMGADLTLTQSFVDMKIDELSVSAPYLLGVRKKVIECN